MNKLIQLDTGDWIDPNHVVSVRALPLMSCMDDSIYLPRMVITHVGGVMSTVEFDAHVDPFEKANELADRINAFR